MPDGSKERDHIAATLSRYAKLDAADRAAIARLPVTPRTVAAGTSFVLEGERPVRCVFVVDGIVYRRKLTAAGARAIVGLGVPGDLADVQNLYLGTSDHDLVALSKAETIEVEIADLKSLAEAHPRINAALWTISLIDASIFREWLLSVGRRDARSRIAHLLCEMAARLARSADAIERTFELPMTQEQLGDALGLTSIHVNRVFKALEQDGLITRRRREVVIVDRDRLCETARFNERYLHLSIADDPPAGTAR